MRLKLTLSKLCELKYLIFCTLLLSFTSSTYSQSTLVHAQTITNQANTDNAANATDANLNTFARVRASSGLALGLGAYTGHIELQFANPVPANTTSYVKIRTSDELLPALLGGSLGNLLSGVLGSVLIGNQEFSIQAKNGANVILQGDSQDVGEFATNRLRIVSDPAGNYYIAITPNQTYDRLRLINRIGSLLGFFNVRNLDVYDAFYIGSADNCGQPTYTSFDASGLTLDLLTLSGAGVTNPGNAIDGNNATYSQLSLGIVGVAASIEQTAYFHGPSGANDQFNVRLRLDPSLVELGVANSIQFVAQNGPNTVNTFTLGSLLNAELLTLLQGNQIVNIQIQTSAPANRLTVRYNSLLNVGLNQTLDLFEISRIPRAPVITDAFTLNPQICAGSMASLIATTSPGYQLQWFTTATSSTPLATVASGQPFVTPALNTDTSYFVAAIKTGCPQLSPRIQVRVDVVPLPTANDINITSPLSACQGNITLSPTTAVGNSVVRYFTSQDMTQEITTGFSGNLGVTYVKNPTTGTLTISGLTAANSPYNLYIALQAEGLCTNAPGTLKQVTVNFSQQLVVNVNASLQACGSANLANAILNVDPNNTYQFYNSASQPITAQAAANITASGNFFIQAFGPNGTCASTLTPVSVTINQQPVITLGSNALVTNVGSTVTLNATASVGNIVWYNSSGVALAANTAGPFASPGVYSFTAVATNAGCTSSAVVTVTVLDPALCPPLRLPDYANTQTSGSILTGGVANGSNAVDANLQTYSTIVTGIGLLGVGTTWQTLEWEETIPAGTPVTVKLGSEYSGLTLLGGFSVIGTKRNASGIPQPIGLLQPVSGSLLDLLPGQNTFEYTFVPSNASGPQAYDGVRVVIGSTVSVAQNAKVFDAFYYTSATQVPCSDDARDVLYGAVDLGVGALTSTVGVADAYNAIDNSNTTAATMFSGLGVLAAAEMTVVFNTPSIVGDQVRMRLSKPGTILSLGLLNGITIQPMLGNAVVGTAVSASLLSLELINGGQAAIVTFTPNTSFDRLRIRYGGVAGVLEFLNVHDVDRLANTAVVGADANNQITACQGQTISVASTSGSTCTSFVWYDAETGGNVVASGNSFTIPANLAAGTYTYWIQPIRYGCPFLSRGRVTVNVTATAPANAIQSVSINGGSQTSICTPTGNVTLAATLNTSLTITNPVFQWYSFDGTNRTLIAGQTSATLALTGLAAGTYTYFVGLSSTQFCQTAAANLTQVTFTILPPSTAANITIADAGICLGATATVTPTSSLASSQFTYYFTNATTQPITNGLVVGGVTYTIAANGALSVSGLTAANSPYTYYVAVTSTTTCLNLAGNLADVLITVGSLPTPTTTSVSQTFCASTNPTVGNIQVNEPNVLFYTAATGGTLIPATTPLVNGSVYYATLSNGTCESTTRLAITVTIGNPQTPTTNASTQNFCALSNPTVANISVNQTGVVFYNQALGGTQYAANAPLVAGTYYAAIRNGNCESPTRLAIAVTIGNPPTPTTSSASQNFCVSSNATVADIDVNQTNVNIYNQASGGTPLATSTPLVNGTYYVSSIEAGTGCESVNRLAITITIGNAPTPTTQNAAQSFCLANAPTVSQIQVNETGVVFYDAAQGGNAFSATAPLMSGTYYASLTNGQCESSVRLAITVTVSDPATPTTVNTTQTFCLGNNPTVANIQVNESPVVFYNAAVGGTAIAATTPLVAGTYYVASVVNGCESSVRLAITVIINDPAVPTTLNASQSFCTEDDPTVANLQINEANVNVYTTSTGGSALAPTTPLTNGTYYVAAVESGNNCESSTRLAITVTIGDPATPTTQDDTQNFCQSNNPVVGSIQVNETGVIFYDAPSGGTAYSLTTPLVSGTYYGALVVGSCESDDRLAITVTITDPAAPTTADDSQSFCASDNPVVSDIEVNETSVVFYASATGGVQISPSAPLTAGTYYAANVSDGCESSVRLAIEVIISDPGTPTTASASQNFCATDDATVADLSVNETNIVVYDAATGGQQITADTPLVTGTYYVALVDGQGCESTVRLAIAVNVSDGATPTTQDDSQDFCLIDAPTVASIQVNEAGVIFYDVANGGNPLDPATALASGVYYASQGEGLCKSEIRLAITVTVNDPAAPTTSATTQTFCQGDNPTVGSIQTNETTVVIYDVATGGTAIDPATPLTAGTYYIANLINGCESTTRLEITVIIDNPGTPTTNDATQEFCAADNPTIASIQVNETNVVFFDAPTGGTQLDPTTSLVSGTYFAGFANVTCDSGTKLEINVTVNDPATPTTDSATQNFCASSNATVASIDVNESGVTFYDAATGGTAIDPTTPLTSLTYYASLTAGSCESPVRLEISVNIDDPATPTTNVPTQNFCTNANATVADIQVNETGVIYYSASIGGTALDPTTPLVTGIYYAALVDGACESPVRLEISVTIGDPATPTTNATTQNFCTSANATVADIQVNETGVVFYTTASGGTALDAATLLTAGTYYATIVQDGCESAIRLEITITIGNPATPTTTSPTQNFCTDENATVADIQVNETGVVFYTTASGGTALDPATVLTAGTYYAAIVQDGCESDIRLEITVTIGNPGTPTTANPTQNFCLSANATIADLDVNEPNVVFYASATGGEPLDVSTILVTGTYYAALVDGSCESEVRLEIAVVVSASITAEITGGTGNACSGETVTYSTAPGMSNYVWTVIGGSITAGGSTSDNTVTISWQIAGAGVVTVAYTDAICGGTANASLNVTVGICSDLTITKVVDEPRPNIGDEVTFTITVNNQGSTLFTDVLITEAIPSGYTLISFNASAGLYVPGTGLWLIPTLLANASATLTVTVRVNGIGDYMNIVTIDDSVPDDSNTDNNVASASISLECLTVFNEFTPNGDGQNDVFRIDCIENYPNSMLQVFNRYGVLVYKMANYQNNWDGIANQNSPLNEDKALPVGTYYYILELGDGSKPKQGWLYIMR